MWVLPSWGTFPDLSRGLASEGERVLVAWVWVGGGGRKGKGKGRYNVHAHIHVSLGFWLYLLGRVYNKKLQSCIAFLYYALKTIFAGYNIMYRICSNISPGFYFLPGFGDLASK